MIGGGQAGLAAGYYLARERREFVILDAGQRTGDVWRRRWDSLRLFTPACFTHLPGMPFPARGGYLPSKDEMADYLAMYAARFDLPIQLGTRVDELVREGDRYVIAAGQQRLEAGQVIVATGANASSRVPTFADQLDPTVFQLHSAEYRNPGQLRAGAVLVVGAGNSGAEIALELGSRHRTWLAGRDIGHVPITLGCLAYRLMSSFTVDTWAGRTLAAKRLSAGDLVARVRPNDLIEAGVQRVGRVVNVSRGQPMIEGQQIPDVENVVWCTGFVRDYRWIKLPVFDTNGDPMHCRGVVQSEPGLYFVGLPLQSSVLSDLVGGVGDAAKYIVKRIATRASRGRGPRRDSSLLSGQSPEPPPRAPPEPVVRIHEPQHSNARLHAAIAQQRIREQ